MLSIRQLRYALAVWREGTFVRAAEKMNVSQPTISEQVGQLEAHIGFELFRRTGHGVEVTDLGRAFLRQADEVYLSLLRLDETANLLRGTQGKTIAVGVSSGVMPLVVPAIVSALEATGLGVRPEISTITTREIHRRLRDEELHVGITVETDPRTLPPELVAERIATDRMVLIVPRDHSLAGRPSVSLGELAGLPIIMNEVSVGYSDVVLSMFSELGLRARIAATSDNFTTILAIVSEGPGVAIVPFLATRIPAPGRGVAVLALDPEREVHVTMVRRERGLSAETATCVEAMREHIRRAISA